jgi:hypothetical protein
MSRERKRRAKPVKPPSLPALPIEIWFHTQPYYRWHLVESEDVQLLHFRNWDGSPSEFEDGWPPTFRDEWRPTPQETLPEERSLRGAEYVDALLAITEPQQLVDFMNTYGCPIDGVIQDPDERDWHRTVIPFLWGTFTDAQDKLRDAMLLPIPELLCNPEFKRFFRLETFEVTAARVMAVPRDLEFEGEDDKAYCGLIFRRPSLDACCEAIALRRVLADVKYRFCEYCGKPFMVRTKHGRKYCSPAHAHAATMQRSREHQKHERLEENR